jgi:antitoxin (DNA-binding transcriptional repressor) of toxin-antitoxin stability system
MVVKRSTVSGKRFLRLGLLSQEDAERRLLVEIDRLELVTSVTRKRTVATMKTVTIRDFRTRPKQVRDALKREREAVLTANGRPVAVMIPVDASSIDQTLETLRRARALEALRVIRQDSQRRGSARMSTREIDAIIAKTRKARSRAVAG